MQFELTEALIDDILFSMEDQDGEFCLDTVEGVVAGGPDFDNDDGESDRYISLPEWDSASGFRLMERFAAGFRNPLVRGELSSALGRGRGVFRAFKNTLGRYPEAEKLWFSFKEKEMKRKIIMWYNGLLEEWGLEKIGMEPEETGDLVLEDFRFRPFSEEDMTDARELHSFCQEEYKETLADRKLRTEGSPPADNGIKNSAVILSMSQALYNLSNNLFNTSSDMLPVSAMTVESSGGEFAGYVSGVIKDSTLYIQTLEVKAEYRGLGVGEALLEKFLGSLNPDEVSQVLLDLPSWADPKSPPQADPKSPPQADPKSPPQADNFSRVLLRSSFKPYAVRYWLKLRDRLD